MAIPAHTAGVLGEFAHRETQHIPSIMQLNADFKTNTRVPNSTVHAKSSHGPILPF